MKFSDLNGWTNYETWAVSLWIGNGEGSFRQWNEMAREAIVDSEDNLQVVRGIWDRRQASVYALEDQLENYFDEQNPLKDSTTVWIDLLNKALSAVNWQEIATNLVNDNWDEAIEEHESDTKAICWLAPHYRGDKNALEFAKYLADKCIWELEDFGGDYPWNDIIPPESQLHSPRIPMSRSNWAIE